MKFLYAHWRVGYIDAPKDPENYNPFLDILNDPDEKKSLLLLRTPLSFVVLNKYPYNAGHLLILPRREIQELQQLTSEEHTDFFQTIVCAENILKRALNPDGVNIGINLGVAAGAGIPRHLHCHLVPRWTGDTNFMPIIADTKTLPMALEYLWEKLRKFV
jgi:ATP adenylyltransferase